MPEDTTPPGRAVSGPRARRRAAPRSALRAGRAPGARKAEIPGGGGVGGKKGTAQSGQLGLGSAGSARLGHDEAAGVSGGRGEGSLPPLRARWGTRAASQAGMSITLRETRVLLLHWAGKALAGVGLLNWSQGRPPELGQAAEQVPPAGSGSREGAGVARAPLQPG